MSMRRGRRYVNEVQVCMSFEARASIRILFEVWMSVRTHVLNQKNAMTRCHGYTHGFITMVFLKQFGSNCVSCHFTITGCRFNTTAKLIFLLRMSIISFNRTCFMTVLNRCASYKVRQLVIQGFGSVFFKNRGLNKDYIKGRHLSQVLRIIL